MQINFQITGIPELKKKLESLTGSQIQSAISMAINKTAAKGLAEITRAITQRYEIKGNEVRNSMSLRSSKPGTLEANLLRAMAASKQLLGDCVDLLNQEQIDLLQLFNKKATQKQIYQVLNLYKKIRRQLHRQK